MEIVAWIIWVALGIFVIVKKGAVGIAAPPILGTICAILFFLSIYICGEVLLRTESVVCFISSIFFCFFLLLSSTGGRDSGLLALGICGVFLVPFIFLVDILKSISTGELNLFSILCYIAWAVFDSVAYLKSREEEQQEEKKENVQTK